MESPPHSSPKELRLQGSLCYNDEPRRKEGLIVASMQPFNAEPPLSVLTTSYLTNEDIFYARNHGPVPIFPDPTTYRFPSCIYPFFLQFEYFLE